MNKISEKIKKIRLVKQRNLHDCAKLLGISKEEYLQFEQGKTSLSLPSIELLAIYLEVPAKLLFGNVDIEFDNFSLLSDEKKQIFANLRNKMIGAQLAFARENKGLSLENLNEITGMSVSALASYENGLTPIPLDELILICEQLDLSVQSLFLETMPIETQIKESESQNEPGKIISQQSMKNDEQEDDQYQQILEGIKNIPEKDQAEIAKLLLEKLKKL